MDQKRNFPERSLTIDTQHQIYKKMELNLSLN